MHGIYKLKDKIIEELEEFGSGDEIKSTELPTIDMLAHTAKNLAKLIALCEEDNSYSYGSYGNRYYGREMEKPYRGRSYGRTMRYDDMGGYSGGQEWMVDMVKDLRDRSTNENMRKEFDEFIRRIEK